MIGYLLIVWCLAMIQNGLLLEVFNGSLYAAVIHAFAAGITLGFVSVKSGKAWYVIPSAYLVMYNLSSFMFSV